MHVNGKVFEQITDGELQRSVNYQLHHHHNLSSIKIISQPSPTAMDQQQLSDVNQ